LQANAYVIKVHTVPECHRQTDRRTDDLVLHHRAMRSIGR